MSNLIQFGKHRDKTYSEVVKDNPDYCDYILGISDPFPGSPCEKFIKYLHSIEYKQSTYPIDHLKTLEFVNCTTLCKYMNNDKVFQIDSLLPPITINKLNIRPTNRPNDIDYGMFGIAIDYAIRYMSVVLANANSNTSEIGNLTNQKSNTDGQKNNTNDKKNNQKNSTNSQKNNTDNQKNNPNINKTNNTNDKKDATDSKINTDNPKPNIFYDSRVEKYLDMHAECTEHKECIMRYDTYQLCDCESANHQPSSKYAGMKGCSPIRASYKRALQNKADASDIVNMAYAHAYLFAQHPGVSCKRCRGMLCIECADCHKYESCSECKVEYQCKKIAASIQRALGPIISYVKHIEKQSSNIICNPFFPYTKDLRIKADADIILIKPTNTTANTNTANNITNTTKATDITYTTTSTTDTTDTTDTTNATNATNATTNTTTNIPKAYTIEIVDLKSSSKTKHGCAKQDFTQLLIYATLLYFGQAKVCKRLTIYNVLSSTEFSIDINLDIIKNTLAKIRSYQIGAEYDKTNSQML